MSKWEIVKLGEVFSFIRNGASIKQGVIGGGYPITRIETIANNEVDRNKMGYAGIYDTSKVSSYVLRTGDILMSHINSEKHLGKTAVYEQIQNEIVLHGMNLLCLRPIETLINFKYTHYFFKSNAFKYQIPKITKKSVNQASFTVTALKELLFPLPPLETQIQIAKTLDTSAELLAMRKQQLAELDNLTKSIFYDMFGDPVSNEKGWGTKALLSVGKFISGGTPSKERDDYWKGNFPWVSPKDMKVPYISAPQNFISDKVFEETSLKKIAPGHLLIVVRGMILAHTFPTAINNVEVSINQDMKAIKPIDEFNVIYLKNCLDNMTHQILEIVTTAGHGTKKFDADSMEKVSIPLPSLHLQNQFATIVTKIEEQKALVQKAIDEMQHLFDSLMSEYFE
ncbi:restriction endonuclease subunit S [Paenibacillus lautus]|uniref:restriction endonuclease subunit S n=1 Tax=Paenibacillus lautus TaxID=1401 RepID=UPI003D270524